MFSAGRGSSVRVRGRGRKMSTELGLNPHKYMIKRSIFDIQTLCESVLKRPGGESVGSSLSGGLKE